MISASYPIKNSTSKLEITIERPELDPESRYGDKRCRCLLQCDEYEKEFYAYGVDDIQCIWLCLKKIKEEIKNFQDATGKLCEYTYYEEEKFLKN